MGRGMKDMDLSSWRYGCLIAVLLLLLPFSTRVTAATIPLNECLNPPNGAVFCEDFEGSNPKSDFNDYDGNPDTENQIIRNEGPSSDPANRVVRLRVPSGQGGVSDLLKELSTGYDRLYARWYFMYEPGFNFNAHNHGSGLAAGNRYLVGSSGNRPAGNDYAGFFMQYQENTNRPYAYSYYRGMYQDCNNPQGSCWGDSLPCVYDSGASYCKQPQHRPSVPLPNLIAGQWYCVEQMVDLGTPTTTGQGADGRLTIWLDSNLLGDFQDLWIRTSADLRIHYLWLSLFHHDGTHSTAGELIDNVVVSTQPIGCGATEPGILNPPRNLRITSEQP